MKILLIEDNVELMQNIQQFLSNVGIRCETAHSLYEAEDKLLGYVYDCILLDIMLPDGNGLRIFDVINSLNIRPNVLIISAKDALNDKLEGLDLGADDYLAKPFHLAELHARIKALYRRSKLGGQDILHFNEMAIDHQNLTVRIHETQLELTKKEFDLLVFFVTNKNRVLGKQVIAQHLWGDYTDNLANFDFVYQHIKNLRKKICAAGGKDYLTTVYGIGYKLDEYVP